MAWELTATGDCDAAAERDLADRVARLLATPKYGTMASQLGGTAHNGPVHEPPPKAQAKD